MIHLIKVLGSILIPFTPVCSTPVELIYTSPNEMRTKDSCLVTTLAYLFHYFKLAYLFILHYESAKCRRRILLTWQTDWCDSVGCNNSRLSNTFVPFMLASFGLGPWTNAALCQHLQWLHFSLVHTTVGFGLYWYSGYPTTITTMLSRTERDPVSFFPSKDADITPTHSS